MTKKSNFYFVIPESEIIGCEFREWFSKCRRRRLRYRPNEWLLNAI